MCGTMQADLKYGSSVYQPRMGSLREKNIENVTDVKKFSLSRRRNTLFTNQAFEFQHGLNAIFTAKAKSSSQHFPPLSTPKNRYPASTQLGQIHQELHPLCAALATSKLSSRDEIEREFAWTLLLLKTMILLASCCSGITQALNGIDGFMQYHGHHAKCLLRTKWIQLVTMIWKGIMLHSLSSTVNPSSTSFEQQHSPVHLGGDTPGGITMQEKRNKSNISFDETCAEHVIILSSPADGHDDYGFFADFEEDNMLNEEDACQAFARVWDNHMNTMCSWPEEDEEDD